MTQHRELTAHDWWSLHVGHLRHERSLSTHALAGRIIYKLDAGKTNDAAAMLRLFFTKITPADGADCLLLAKRYCVGGAAHHADALALFRAARVAGALTQLDDVLSMGHLLCRAGETSEALGLLAPAERQASTDARLRSMQGTAWLIAACNASASHPAAFAAARDEAAKALRVAQQLAPNDAQIADNLALLDTVYPGPTYGPVGAALPERLTHTPNLRALTLAALRNREHYAIAHVYAVGSAVRTETSHYDRPENTAAIQALQPAAP